jgi:hypothetical protein
MTSGPAKRAALSVKLAGARGRAPPFSPGAQRRAPLPLPLNPIQTSPMPSKIPTSRL